jgi:hypothetical protein
MESVHKPDLHITLPEEEKKEEEKEKGQGDPEDSSRNRFKGNLTVNINKREVLKKWFEMRISGRLPSRRSYLASCIYDDKYFSPCL